MSTVRLKTSHKGLGEKGDVVSVPFGKGKELVGIGAAEYLHPTAPPVTAVSAAAAEKMIAELEAENAKLKKENAELTALLAAASDPGARPAEKPAEKSAAKK